MNDQGICITNWGHILQRSPLCGNSVDSVRFLEWIISYQASRINVGRVEALINVRKQTILSYRCVPDSQFVDISRETTTKFHSRTFKRGHILLGNDRSALAVVIEAGSLSAHHVESQMMPTSVVREIFIAGNDL